MKLNQAISKILLSASERVVRFDHKKQVASLSRASKRTYLKERRSDSESHRVLFIHMHGSEYLLALEAILFNRLRLEGVEPFYLTCSQLPWCNNRRYFVAPDRPSLCANCNVRNQVNAFNLGCHLHALSEFESVGIRNLAAQLTANLSLLECLKFQWEGVPLGALCEVSVSRFLCREARSINTPSDLCCFRKFIESGIILADSLRCAIEILNPTVIIQNSGRFFWYAIADFLARKSGVGVVSYEGDGGFGRTWTFRSKVPASSLEIGEIWSPTSNPALSSEQKIELVKLLEDRRSGAMVKGFKDQGAFTFDRGAPPDLVGVQKPIIAMFTNLTFDSQVAGRHTIFEGVIDWLAYTIQNISDFSATFVVRIHPAEVQEHEGEYSRERVIEELQNKKIEIPKNVIIISPSEKVDSYALAEVAALSIVYTSTIGLELMIAGHQVMICGRAHYAGKGFGVQPFSKDDYISRLRNIKQKEGLSTNEISLANSYGYAFWFKSNKQLRLFTTKGRFQVDRLLLDRPSQLKRGENKALDEITDQILEESRESLRRQS